MLCFLGCEVNYTHWTVTPFLFIYSTIKTIKSVSCTHWSRGCEHSGVWESVAANLWLVDTVTSWVGGVWLQLWGLKVVKLLSVRQVEFLGWGWDRLRGELSGWTGGTGRGTGFFWVQQLCFQSCDDLGLSGEQLFLSALIFHFLISHFTVLFFIEFLFAFGASWIFCFWF